MEHFLRVIEVYAFLAFRALGNGPGAGIHYRKGSVILNCEPLYYIYVGLLDLTILFESFVFFQNHRLLLKAFQRFFGT